MNKLICGISLAILTFTGSVALSQNTVVVVPLGGSQVGGSDGQFQYNDKGKIAGAEMYFDKSTNEIKTGPYGVPGTWSGLNLKCNCKYPYRKSPGADDSEAACTADDACLYGFSLSKEGFLGLGTVNPPEAPLSVLNGDIRLQGYTEFYDVDATTPFGKRVGYIFSNTDTLWLGTYSAVNGKIQLEAVSSSGAGTITVNSNGKVGINNDNPQATLDINGYAKLKVHSSEPVNCESSHKGVIALNSGYQLCVCKQTYIGPGTFIYSWVQTDGTTGCSF